MPRDIIVTTPKNKMAIAAEEARICIEGGGGFYFRTFTNVPRDLRVGTRIFYVEDGYVRGFGVVSEIKNGNMQCGTTGHDWGNGTHAIMRADSWRWIKPIPMKGFQGWRYFDSKGIKVIGSWLHPKPSLTAQIPKEEEVEIFITESTYRRLNGEEERWWPNTSFRRKPTEKFCYKTRVPKIAIRTGVFEPSLCEPDIVAERCKRVV